MTEQLFRPGTDPEVHDKGWRTPVGFIQNAFYESRPGTYVEAVEVVPWKKEPGKPNRGTWLFDEPAGRIRLVIGPGNGEGWAQAHTDMTLAEARDLRDRLQDEIRRLTKSAR